MQVLIETNAADLSPAELIGQRKADGLYWLLSTYASPDYRGGTMETFTAFLCAKRERHIGRKHTVHYEWLGFRDIGKTFTSREDAAAYIAKQLEA